MRSTVPTRQERTEMNDERPAVLDESKPITYPARPTKGGPVGGPVWRMRSEAGTRSDSAYLYSPKYNGWRVLLHVPTGKCYNRHLHHLSIQDEFQDAIEFIQDRVHDVADALTGYDWLDCEGLERRHGIGRGSLIVLDVPSMGSSCFEDRMCALSITFSKHNIHEKPKNNSVYVPCHFPREGCQVIDEDLFRLNQEWDAEFYEGMVGVKADSEYPVQLIAADKKSPYWVKHRWSNRKEL